MIIACPRCETSFSLPDELYKPGKKARCSNCGCVFAMPEPVVGSGSAEPEAPSVPEPSKAVPSRQASSKSRIPFILIAVLLSGLLAYGGYLVFTSLMASPKMREGAPDAAPPQVEEPAEEGGMAGRNPLVSSIVLEEIRQFLVDNVEVGKLMVVQGFAVNTSAANKDYVSVEVRILDENNKVLARMQQLCGVPLTLFQLQTLTEKDLKETLGNRTTILVNNTNVPQGGKVPFVVVFPNPPESMRTFEVQVVDVREAPSS